MTKKIQAKWTVVQHSGYGYGGHPGFAKAIETRQLDNLADQTKVLRAGGLLFNTWQEADAYETKVNCGGDDKGLPYPEAPGTFSDFEIDGLRIYLPPRGQESDHR